MFKAFRDRRPWAASLVCLVLSPVLGMLYLNRGRYAFLYWLGSLLFVVFCLAVWPSLFPTKHSGLTYIIDFPVNVLGSVHGFFLAKGWAPETRLRWYAHWYSTLGIALIFPGLLALCIRTFLFQPFDLPSTAMAPSFNRGDYFWVSKRAYDVSLPQRGDVVVFFAPAYHSYFIKRIVGLPGDRVQMIHGRLAVNGTLVPTRHLEDIVVECATGQVCRAAQYEETYPGGKSGRVVDQVADGPLDNTDVFDVPQESYFVLGDNRDNSDDSREDLGFVPRSTITGRVAYKFFAAGHWVWQTIR
jgi:signal peptidase I